MDKIKCKKCGTTENVKFDGMCKKCYEENIVVKEKEIDEQPSALEIVKHFIFDNCVKIIGVLSTVVIILVFSFISYASNIKYSEDDFKKSNSQIQELKNKNNDLEKSQTEYNQQITKLTNEKQQLEEEKKQQQL